MHRRYCLCLVFWTVLIYYVDPATGQFQVIGSAQPVLAVAGDDVILPCHLQPAINVYDLIVEWLRPDLDPPYVHVHQDGRLAIDMQNPLYQWRTSLFTEELKKGNVSLRLFNVKLSDEGKYRCFVPTLKSQAKESTIQLIVGSVSIPVIRLLGRNQDSSGVVLLCESKGWYPQPKVEWRDRDGSILSAGDTETLRDPDGLYTVRRRVTVKQTDTDTNRFTCRVQQQHINQTRETQIHVPADFFNTALESSPQPNSSAHSIGIGIITSIIIGIIIGIAVAILCVIPVVFIMRKRNKGRAERKNGKVQNDDDTMKLKSKKNDLESAEIEPLNRTEKLREKEEEHRMEKERIEREKDDLTKTTGGLEKRVSEFQSKLKDKDCFLKTERCDQIMRSLVWLYSSDQDILHVTDLEKYVLDLIPYLPHLKALEESYIDKNIQTFYAQTVTHKFFFFLDPQQNGKVRIKDIIECPFLDDLLELKDEKLSKEKLELNWFSVPSFERVHSQYQNLNRNHIKLSKEKLSQCGTDKLYGVLLYRVYKYCFFPLEYKLDLKMYLDFVLALENRKEPVALQNILILLDKEKRETIDNIFLDFYFEAIQEQRRIHDLAPTSFKDVKDKIVYILNLDNTSSITFKDLLTSGHAEQVINILIGLNSLCTDGNRKMPVANDDNN